jgi:hypothetical protein
MPGSLILVQPHGLDSGPRPVKRYANNEAMSGAMCPSTATLQMGIFPGGEDAEITGFLEDEDFRNPHGSSFRDVDAASTVFAIWAGPIDLGVGGYLTNEEALGQTANDYVEIYLNTF